MLAPEPRRVRKQQQVRNALIESATQLMAKFGPDGVTMLQIAEHADVGAGTVYNYFPSKDELASAVMDSVYQRFADRIHEFTRTFDDPVDALVYAIRESMIVAATSPISSRLLSNSVLLAESTIRLMGPAVVSDLEKARSTGAAKFGDADLVWRLVAHAICGFGIEVRLNNISLDALDDSLGSILGILGLELKVARKYARKKWPEFPWP